MFGARVDAYRDEISRIYLGGFDAHLRSGAFWNLRTSANIARRTASGDPFNCRFFRLSAIAAAHNSPRCFGLYLIVKCELYTCTLVISSRRL